jgi:hypothetical protein
MSKRVYLRTYISNTFHLEDTPVSIRIPLSQAPVNALYARLQPAYKQDDRRLVRRIPVCIDWLVDHGPVDTMHERCGVSLSTIYAWRTVVLLWGLARLVYRHGGGRPEQVTHAAEKTPVRAAGGGAAGRGL